MKQATSSAKSSFPFRLLRACGGALLIGFSVCLPVQHVAAQIFPGQGDDTTSSMGVFRITVDPAFRVLLEPTGSPTFFVGYTGYRPSDGKLTSPVCIDSATTIGRSARHSRIFAGFPVPIGAGSWDTILGYGDYPAIPFLWFAAPAPTEEVLTEIKSFALLSVNSRESQCPTNDPRIVPVPLSWPMVKAGTFAGISPRSLGIVQENVANGAAAPDFPAHSFFDIFVNVNLPPLPGTESSLAFPPTGAVLYNDSPLIITNLNLTSFPPSVIYIHGETPAVPLKFKFSNPPYWDAGDVFGYLVLAGHGTITNDCANAPALTALLDAALGPIGTSAPELPVEWLRTNNLCPSPGSSYNSVRDIDIIHFTVAGAGTVSTRNFSHSNFPNPIPPPPVGGSAVYSAPATLVTAELSLDGQTWVPVQASGPLTAKIANTSGSGGTSTFDTEMLQLNLSGNGPFGPFMLRESPTRQSLGKHTIRASQPGFRISGFFDVFLELSTDGGVSWIPADRAIRVQPSSPPAAPGSIFISRAGAGSNAIILNWLGSFQLQHASTVLGPFTDIPGATTGPFTLTPTGSEQYFRLR